jgi:hypothetical protein
MAIEFCRVDEYAGCLYLVSVPLTTTALISEFSD